MIHELDQTLTNLLREAFGEQAITFDFQAPTRNWSVEKPAVNLFLYDIRENNKLRQYRWDTVASNGHQGVQRQQPPIVFDCTYLITCWAAAPEQEHWLLAQCLQALANDPVLEKVKREGGLAQVKNIITKLGMHDQLTNPADIWSVLENTLRPSLTYCVTLPFERASEEMPESLVHAVEFKWQQINPPTKSVAALERHTLPQPGPLQKKRDPSPVPGTKSTSFAIAGTVRDLQGKPLEGVQVRIGDDASFAVTNDRGRYILGRLITGTYTLVAQSATGSVTEQMITIVENELLESGTEHAEVSFDFEMEN